ncbi:MAG: Smr/MutS family protein [Candidatus Latescibacterota bacterium]
MDDKDRELFLKALENLPKDVQFAKYGGMPERPKKEPTRPKTVHDLVIDLHGVTRAEALARLRTVLERTRGKHRRILVITGKGNNSEEGRGVLRETVARFLETSGAAYIREYKYASPEFGGEGAFDIRTK